MNETTNRAALIASLKAKATSLRLDGGDDPTDTETLLLAAAAALANPDDAVMSTGTAIRAAMTHHHNTRILCDTCKAVSTHHTVTAAFDAIDQHILETGHRISYFLSPNGWLLFGGI